MADRAVQKSQPIKNPFTPEFGKVPPYFAGREEILSDMLSSLEAQTGGICTLFVGARGTGKTALLAYLGREAERLGWVAANVSAIPGMLEDVIQRSEEAAAHLVDVGAKRRLSGVSIAGIGGVSICEPTVADPNWRTRMNSLLDLLDRADAGLLITVDEVDVSLDEMVQLIATYQHFVREGRRVGLLMAGLPYSILSLLNGKSTSFLRRAQRFDLQPLADYEVAEAFHLTVENGGRFIDQAALEAAVDAIDGFPFMFQLLGHRAWRAHAENPAISVDDIQTGGRIARRELESRVFDVTYAELSKGDRDFLKAMLEDTGESTRADLMERLGKPSGHISTYKKRLIQGGVITETVEGGFRFALPGFREYLKQR